MYRMNVVILSTRHVILEVLQALLVFVLLNDSSLRCTLVVHSVQIVDVA